MTDMIAKAAAWASRAEHNGAAFTLRIKTADGDSHHVTIQDLKATGYLLRKTYANNPEPVFINPAQVCFVTVQW